MIVLHRVIIYSISINEEPEIINNRPIILQEIRNNNTVIAINIRTNKICLAVSTIILNCMQIHFSLKTRTLYLSHCSKTCSVLTLYLRLIRALTPSFWQICFGSLLVAIIIVCGGCCFRRCAMNGLFADQEI